MKRIEKFTCLNCNNILNIKGVEEKVFFTLCNACGCKMKVKRGKGGILIKVVGIKNDFVNQNEQLKMEVF